MRDACGGGNRRCGVSDPHGVPKAYDDDGGGARGSSRGGAPDGGAPLARTPWHRGGDGAPSPRPRCDGALLAQGGATPGHDGGARPRPCDGGALAHSPLRNRNRHGRGDPS